jgi:hypothetical protein
MAAIVAIPLPYCPSRNLMPVPLRARIDFVTASPAT